ncbi:MAG: hypothetical protein ACPKNR_11640 [Pleomorphochaeta sp.]
MKRRTILVLLLLGLNILPIFSSSADIDLKSKIDEQPLTYNLYRKTDSGLILIEEDSTYTIDEINPLTTNTMITDFSIIVNSNLNSSRSVTVKVTPSSFTTVLNGDRPFDSGVVPVINTIIDRKVVNAGLNSDKEVYRFNIFVGGKPNLPAGIYKSIVNVDYIIE